MRTGEETLDTANGKGASPREEPSEPGFVVVGGAPALLGAWLPLRRDHLPVVLGRGTVLVRQRPGTNDDAPAIDDPFLSREQLCLTSTSTSGVQIDVENRGKRALVVDGREVERTTVRAGEVIEVRDRLLLLATSRPRALPASKNLTGEPTAFGRADAHGFVGESVAAWKLRDTAAFVAARAAHVLLLGASGTGKEIIAQLIHDCSRTPSRLVSRNAATLPSGLIDAELFGHVANYPNAGMPERPGLIGEADGGTLFLDEIGELPDELATKLLRVLDERGEYQRLGDTRARKSKFRLIGATNRALTALKADVAARFRLRVSMPPLDDRREDIPLLARHLLQRAAVDDPAIGARFFEGWNGKTGEPRIALDLMRVLVTHVYSTHVRELDVLLWASLAGSTGDTAELVPEVEASLAAGPPSESIPVDVRALTADTIRAAIAKAGSHDQAWRDLGLANRHVLKRLVKKHGLREPQG